MTVSPESPPALASEQPRRAGRELLLATVFGPAAELIVPVLRRARLSPPAVVLANATAGLGAALVLASGSLWPAAVLLQVKTVLDNADGQLARVTGRVTLAGRYLDTLADLLVNAAVFVALGYVTGQPVLAAAAFVALTVVLAADFNATNLYRTTNGIPTPVPYATGSRVERVLGAAYAALLGPLDRAFRALAARRLPPGTSYDAFTVTVLANMGLTTQLAVLGACLALGVPVAYLWLCLACLALLVPLHVRAERRAR